MSYLSSPVLPSITGYGQGEVTAYLSRLHAKNRNTGFGVCTYTHGATVASYGYVGGIYAPTLNRIYLVPFVQATEATWHYIDCLTGAIVPYLHGASALQGNAYIGAVYSPTQDRVYLVPYGQSSNVTWHYIDGKTGAVTGYAHGINLSNFASGTAYGGGCYAPTLDRVYFAPAGQGVKSVWHYVDCSVSAPAIVEFSHGMESGIGGYVSGTYSPASNRIYFFPQGSASQDNWHYVDCSNGTVHAYSKGAGTFAGNAYFGGAYSPTQDRVYLAPYMQAPDTAWHYINCADATVGSYSSGTPGVAAAYSGAVYSPCSNRIFFTPLAQGPQASWHYIDCSTGASVLYAHGVTAIGASQPYHGGVYNPLRNRVYLNPSGQGPSSYWHYIQEHSSPEASPTLMVSAPFNNY